MKVGDLVRMKYEMWWKVRDRKKDYTEEIGIVLNKDYNAVKIFLPNGQVKSWLAENWEVVNEDKRKRNDEVNA